MAQAVIIENKLPVPTTVPYPPSWFDRFKAWIERLPGSDWLYYLLAGAILYAALTTSQWLAGAYPMGTFNLFHAWLCFEIVLVLAGLHYLDRIATRAVHTTRPTLMMTSTEFELTAYKLAHLPARSTLIASVLGTVFAAIWMIVGVNVPAWGVLAALALTSHSLSIGSFFVLFLVTWWCFGALFVHTFHQLKLISEIYGQHTRINLYDPGPLYAFSGVTARTAVLYMLIVLGWLAYPGVWTQGTSMVNGIVMVIVALAVFIIPLWGIHTRLVEAKDSLMSQIGSRIESSAEMLHHVADTKVVDDATKIKDLLLGLETEQRIVEKMPTYPWAAGTFRVLLTAILLPIVLFVVQFVISRFLTP